MRLYFKIILHLIYWLTTAYIVTRIFGINTIEIIETAEGESEIIDFDKNFVWATLVACLVGAFIFYTNIFYLLKSYFKNKNVSAYLVRILLVILFAISILVFINRIFVYGTEIMDSIYLYPSISLHLSLFLFFLACSFAYAFTMEYYKNEKLTYEITQDKLHTELNYLKSQINPHFLFNTLNNLYSIAQEHQDKELERGIGELSNLMRYMLYESRADLVSLKKEIRHIESFIRIQHLRFNEEDELLVDFQIEGGVGGVEIAPMILLPFIENAFKHGIRIGHPSIIRITIKVTNKMLYFKVKNKVFRDHKMVKDASGIGLENVTRRLKLIYPETHRLDILETSDHYEVILEIDLNE